MKATSILTATAILLSFACSKSDQASVDSAALAARNEATPDSAAAAPLPNAGAATTTAGAAKSGTSSAAAGGTAASAAATARDGAPQAKADPPASAEVAAVPNRPEVESAPPSGETVAAAAPAAAGAADPSTGKIPYDASCRKCHGVLGVPPKGMKTRFPKLAAFDAAFFTGRSDDSVVKVLTRGTTEDMPSFKDKLSLQEMVAVAAYMRTLGRAR